VGKFRTWLTNSIGGLTYQNNNLTGSYAKGHGIDGVYVYNSISNSSSQTPAVRVINGSRLPPPGFTVATPFPLYVEGSFNTTTDGVNFSTTLGDVTNTYAAALMGDAVTILSAGWSDAYNSSTSLTSRGTSTTTINAACLEGIVHPMAPVTAAGWKIFCVCSKTGAASPFTTMVLLSCCFRANITSTLGKLRAVRYTMLLCDNGALTRIFRIRRSCRQ